MADLWYVTVIQCDGLHFMRPEKSWRPIVTVEIDKHHLRETTLGCTGQNPDCRELLCFDNAEVDSVVELKVWYRSQSKKKKKRNLVASASHSLGELLKKQDPKAPIQVKLNCKSPSRRNCTGAASRGKPQNGAALYIRVRPPKSFELKPSEPPDDMFLDSESCLSSEPPPSPIDEPFHGNITIQDDKNIKPYTIDSDDEVPPYEDKPLIQENIVEPKVSIPIMSPVAWLVASILPQYTEKIAIPSQLSLPERMLASFTVYAELKNASAESQYDEVFRRLQMEWTYVGGLLVALAAVDTAVFSISPDSIFTVDSYARSAIATSSVASGLGIACDAWFLLRYTWADLQTFLSRAKDLYDSYFFFALSARVPVICMFISALSLMGFLGLVAFDAWPTGVMVVCFFIGLTMTLQFLVYGVHWFGTKVAQGGRGGVRLIRRMTG